MNNPVTRSIEIIKALDALPEDKFNDSPEAEELRSEGEHLWRRMNEDERKQFTEKARELDIQCSLPKS